MELAVTHRREKLSDNINEAIKLDISGELKEAFESWLSNMMNADKTKELRFKIEELLEKEIKKSSGAKKDILESILKLKDHIVIGSINFFTI